MLEYLLFAGYLVLFCWLVTKVRFFTRSGLTKSQIIILFLLKIMAGIFYGWVGIYYGNMAQMVDTWSYHYLGMQELKLLHDNPQAYFTDLFHNPYHGLGNFFASSHSYWNDLKANAIIKLISVFDIFSFNNYYINVIFYSFLSMFGPVAFFRVMCDIFPGKSVVIAMATFLIPSFIYWTSGLHKDGLVFIGLGLVTYHLYFGLKEHSFSFKRWVALAGSFLLVFIFKNNIAAVLLPAILAWILAARFPKRSLAIFSLVYLVFGVLFFTLKYANPKLNFPQTVVEKQEAFFELKGGSKVTVPKLEPTVTGFLRNTPKVLELTLLRPYPSDVMHLLSLAACLETIALLLITILFFLYREKKRYPSLVPIIYFFVFFSFSLLLSVGYTVNFLGAIVRYRSHVIPFLFVPMMAQINWKRINDLVFSFMKK